jgi:hypothetical protein
MPWGGLSAGDWVIRGESLSLLGENHEDLQKGYVMTEEAIMDELTRLAMDWALDEEPVGTTVEVTDIVEVEPGEWVTDTSSITPDRAFVVNVLLNYDEVTGEADVEGEREVSAVYGYFSDKDRLDFAYGADYLLIEPDDEEDEEFDDEEFGETEE